MSGQFSLQRAGVPTHRTFLGVEKSLTGRRWVHRLDDAGAMRALAMAQSHEINEIVARVLAGRGVAVEASPAFLNPTLRMLMPDPSVLTDMRLAAARIADAVVSGQKIAIFGDYDVDGASSAALLARFLRHQGLDPTIYIPDRIFEGYGPNVEAMKSLAAAGTVLTICVDCGSSSFEALETARSLGADVVVIDHHEVGVDLPPAVAIVNPNRQDDMSGLGHLAAVGVTYLTIVAVNRLLRERGWYANGRAEPDLLQWLDLVALGTVCDVVPLVGLNRAIVAKGLLAMGRRANIGLAALADVARVGGPVAPWHLGFLIGPRINAGGRIGDAALGARLLTTLDTSEATTLAAELDRLNAERQALEAAMVEEAIAEAEAQASDDGPSVIVTSNASWHPGVVGLIASRLKERFQRPAIAIAFLPNGVGTGSGRSIAGVDLGRSIRGAVAAGVLRKGGGHAMAAGLTIERGRLADFRAYLEADLRDPVGAYEDGGLAIDAALSARGAGPELIERLDRAGPFGAGHPEPVFAFPSHTVTFADVAGSSHIRLTLTAPDGTGLKAMAFRAAGTKLGETLLNARGQVVHAAGSLSIDQWQGRRQASLRLMDVALPETG